MPALVTGASGFVGGRLVAALGREGDIRALVRRADAMPAAAVGDLLDPVSLRAACEGMESVFHCAGYAHAFASSDPDAHRRINFEGTRNLLVAAGEAGVRRFVFLSSVKAMAEPGDACVDEDWPGEPATPYGRAKRAGEAAVLEAGAKYGMHVVNLRLAMVYGRGGRGNLERMARGIRAGWFPPLPDTGNRRSLVHVDDVAPAALLAAAHPAARCQIYLVTDGRPCSGRELYLTIRRALGHPPPRWAVPASVLYGAAALADGALWLAGRRDSAVRAMVDKLLGWACYDSARIERELGYRPRWTFQRYCETGLRK